MPRFARFALPALAAAALCALPMVASAHPHPDWEWGGAIAPVPPVPPVPAVAPTPAIAPIPPMAPIAPIHYRWDDEDDDRDVIVIRGKDGKRWSRSKSRQDGNWDHAWERDLNRRIHERVRRSVARAQRVADRIRIRHLNRWDDGDRIVIRDFGHRLRDQIRNDVRIRVRDSHELRDRIRDQVRDRVRSGRVREVSI